MSSRGAARWSASPSIRPSSVPNDVEVGDDSLMEPIESVSPFFRERGVGGPQQPGGEKGIDPLEQLEEQDTDPVALREQAVATQVLDVLDQAFRRSLGRS